MKKVHYFEDNGKGVNIYLYMYIAIKRRIFFAVSYVVIM